MSDCAHPTRSSVNREAADGIHTSTFHGTDLEELYISAVAQDTSASAVQKQTRSLYEQITQLLAERDAVVVQERVYGALGVAEQVGAARAEVVSGAASFDDVPATYVEGLPCEGDGLSGIHLYAVGSSEAARPVTVDRVLHDGQALGRALEREDARLIYLSGLAGTTPDQPMAATEQARCMFEKAAGALDQAGFGYREVVRTWIYIDDILAWYDDFNPVRTDAYTRFGLLGQGDDYLPASTGIQARSPGQVECVMDLVAVSPSPGAEVTIGRLHNPLQNEAYSYGSAFARAMEVVLGGCRTVYVSGTASIDEEGRSIHLEDIDEQIKRTIHNIEALIGTRGLTGDDICQATVFVKRAEDAARFRELAAGTRLGQLGVCMVADVCRPELLFEIDAVAAKAL